MDLANWSRSKDKLCPRISGRLSSSWISFGYVLNYVCPGYERIVAGLFDKSF